MPPGNIFLADSILMLPYTMYMYTVIKRYCSVILCIALVFACRICIIAPIGLISIKMGSAEYYECIAMEMRIHFVPMATVLPT